MDADKSYKIRDFKIEDSNKIVALGELLIEESKTFNAAIDKQGIIQELITGWANKDIILVAESSNKVLYENSIVGILAASRYKRYFSFETYFEERAFFVRREFRKTHLAKDLIQEYVDRVRRSGVDFASIGVGTELRPKSLVRLYRGFGFNQMCYIASRRFDGRK